MSENVRSALASENVRFLIAAVIALVLIGISQFSSPDTPAQMTEVSDEAPAVDPPVANIGAQAR